LMSAQMFTCIDFSVLSTVFSPFSTDSCCPAGVLALMSAQRAHANAIVDAIDVDAAACTRVSQHFQSYDTTLLCLVR